MFTISLKELFLHVTEPPCNCEALFVLFLFLLCAFSIADIIFINSFLTKKEIKQANQQKNI